MTWIVWVVFSLTTLCLILFVLYKTYVFDYSLVLLLILFSLHFAFYISNIIYLTLLKVIGNFKTYAIQSFGVSFIAFISLWFLIRFIGIYAILVSLIISPLISNYFLKPKLNLVPTETSQAPTISVKDIDWNSFFSINHVAFIGFCGKFLIGFESSNNINYYHYSFIIIYSFSMIIVANLSSITLYNSSVNNNNGLLKSLKLPIFINTISVVIIMSILFTHGDFIIKLLFEGGKFTSQDTNHTFLFLKYLVLPFMILSYTQLLLQPILSKKENPLFRMAIKLISIILICSLIGCILYGLVSKDFFTSLIIFLYLPTITILFILITAIIKYVTQEKRKVQI